MPIAAHARMRAHANVLYTGDVDDTRAFAERNAASARSKSSKHWIKEKKEARRNEQQHAHAQQEDEGPFGEVIAIEDDEGGQLGDEFVLLGGSPARPPRLDASNVRDDPSPTISDGDNEFQDIGGLLGGRLATIREE